MELAPTALLVKHDEAPCARELKGPANACLHRSDSLHNLRMVYAQGWDIRRMSKAQSPQGEASSRRLATNVSLPASLVHEARALDINLSRACEDGLKAGVAEARRAKWLVENRQALDSSNAWIEANGLPLASKRRF